MPHRNRQGQGGAIVKFHLVEKKNRNALHGIFDSEERAKQFLAVTVPEYVVRGYYSDKSLTPESFTVIPAPRS
jgi:hypothetical protein